MAKKDRMRSNPISFGFITTIALLVILPLTVFVVNSGNFDLRNRAQTTGNSIYWGAYIDASSTGTTNNSPWDLIYSGGDTTSKFESQAGKGLSIIHWGEPWYHSGTYQAFPANPMSGARTHGSIPLLDWGSWDYCCGPSQSNFKLSNITAGNFDSYITSWAGAAKAWGHPFFLRFDWEMNGWWQFPWSVQLNGNNPADYVNAWRHVHDLFVNIGATNVTWVWCPNISSQSTSGTTTAYTQLYPGDSYVDWTCLDGYNQNTGTGWLTFNQVFTGAGTNNILNSYQQIVSLVPSKPLMIGETASVEAGDGGTMKANWIKDALTTQLQNNFPNVKAFVWFNWNAGNSAFTYPIESTLTAQAAFASGISSTYFTSNSFSLLTGSPIGPPSGYMVTPVPTATAAPTNSPTIAPTSFSSPTPVDTIPPVVSIVSPLSGSKFPRRSSVTITASATDNIGISKVEFWINGSLACIDVSSPYTCNFTLGGKTGASYAIYAKAYDFSGNSSTSGVVTIYSY